MDEIYEKLFNSVDIKKLWDCKGGYIDTNDCSWYHENWMLLRRLHLVSNPLWHEDFYKSAIRELDCTQKKVLVLGTADFSMPLLCYNAGIKALDICDICNSPLNICNIIAQIYSLNWNTYKGDIKYGLSKKYDIIIDDAFLTRFKYCDKHDVLKKISDSLNPSGFYITTIRKGWNKGEPVVPTLEQKNNFINKALSVAEAKEMDAEVVKKAASSYINNMISYPIKDKDNLKSLVEGIFKIEKCITVSVPGECEPSIYYQVIMKNLKND